MNSEQLRLFINGAFGSEADARKVRKLLDPYLRRSLDEIRQLVELLPDESLARQREWRALLIEVERILEPYNDAFAVELSRQLPSSGAAAAEETTLMLKSVVPQTAGLVPPEVIMADSTIDVLSTKVGPKRLIDLFTSKDGVPPFVKANVRMVDSIVTGGIIQGASTEQIAKAITDELPHRMKAQALAISRTAIQDYNRQVKEEVWNANSDAFARLGLKYEWVSALDSRTCPTCAPLDGEVKDSKGDFPKTPVHVNCRCSVVLIDPEDKDDPRSRYGQLASENPTKGQPGGYATKKKVKGDNLYRKNREFKPKKDQPVTYATFLADLARKSKGVTAADLRMNVKTGKRGVSAEALTVRQFFGSNKKAEQFIRYVNSGRYADDEALRRIL
jgi:SPP1 gp7 family putative phage head morphogenesis protein